MAPSHWLLGAIGAVLSAVVIAETVPGGAGRSTDTVPPARSPFAAPPAAVVSEHLAGWSAALLVRPLFSPDRRPPRGAPVRPAAHVDLPRLAGIILGPLSRKAIFAPAGTRPIVVGEGERIDGGWTVGRIATDAVTLTGPGGAQVVRPSFDRVQHPPPPAPSAPARPPTLLPLLLRQLQPGP